jgi:hypothetical protein
MNFPDCREGAAYDHSFDSPFVTLDEVRGRKKVRTAPKATGRGLAKKEDANIASPSEINHEETKSTKVFLIFLRVLRFFVVDSHRFRASLIPEL